MPLKWENLSLVIVDPIGHLASMQKSILRGVGVRRVAVVETLPALYKDIIFGRDLVMINWLEQGIGFTDLILQIRDKKTSPDPFLGVVIVASCAFGTRIRAALDAGATSFVRIPFSGADVIRHIGHAASPPEGFVDVPGYFGPDRRKRRDPFFEGEDRRRAQSPLLMGAALQKERNRMRDTAKAALEMKVQMMQ